MTDNPTTHKAMPEQWRIPYGDDRHCITQLQVLHIRLFQVLSDLERRVQALDPWREVADAGPVAPLPSPGDLAPAPAAEPAPEALIDPADDIVDAEGKPWNRTMGGALWAKAFCRRFGGDEGLMIGWFCNAIMAGWDHAHWKMEADAQSAPATAPAGSLVEVVARAIQRAANHSATQDAVVFWGDEARAAIAAVVASLLAWHYSDEVVHTAWEAANWLEREAGR
jgi:hypothetical protein